MSRNEIDKVMTIVNLIQRNTVRVNDLNYYYFEYIEINTDILRDIDTMPYLKESDKDGQKNYLEYKNIEEIKSTFFIVQNIVSDAIRDLNINDAIIDNIYGGFDINYLIEVIQDEIENSTLCTVYTELAKVIINTLYLDDIIELINYKLDKINDAIKEASNTIENEADNILCEF